MKLGGAVGGWLFFFDFSSGFFFFFQGFLQVVFFLGSVEDFTWLWPWRSITTTSMNTRSLKVSRCLTRLLRRFTLMIRLLPIRMMTRATLLLLSNLRFIASSVGKGPSTRFSAGENRLISSCGETKSYPVEF